MHGVAERTRTCAACVWRMRAASLCVALCAMHSSSGYQPSPPPIRVLLSAQPSIPALRPALRPQPSSHSPLRPALSAHMHNLAQPRAQPICTSYYTLAQLYTTTLSTRLIR